MIRPGVRRVSKDHRDYSFALTFGGISYFADSLNLDPSLTMPDQNADGLHFGCTGYTTADICTDEDIRVYLPQYTYHQTMLMEGVAPSDPLYEKTGCDVRDSLKSAIVYGLQAVGETPAEALNHRRGAYYNVDLISGMDWFDSLRSALQTGKRTISVATPWYPAFFPGPDGIMKAPNTYDTTFASWHNWKTCGWKTINGVPYLIAKPWQGPNYGDHGFCYFPREVINKVLSIIGAGAFTVAPFAGDNVQTVILTLWQTIASYLRLIQAKLKA